MSDEDQIKKDEEKIGEMELEEEAENKQEERDGKENELNRCEEKCLQIEGKYKRALADYQNLLRQTAREKEEFAKYANENLLLEILPVYDHLKLALKHVDKNSNDKWLEGVGYILKQFKDVLNKLGVEEIITVGEKFDPNTMEALKGEGEIVQEEASSGYKLNGKVIKHAKVILE